MRKIVILLMSVTLVLSMTCVSFGSTVTQKDMEKKSVVITKDAIAADADKKITVELLESGGTQTIIPLFDGTLQLPADAQKSALIAIYKGYWRVHSWKGSYITFGLGITCTSPILTRYQADIEIYNGNFLTGKLLSTAKMDIFAFGGAVQLVDDKKMYTGSTKDIYVRVKNIRAQTTAGTISRPVIGTDVIRP